MRSRVRILIISLVVSSGVFIAVQLPRSAHGQGTPPGYGEPLPGLTAEQLEQFYDGKRAFVTRLKRWQRGPTFNARSCAECHAAPATGGGSAHTVLRFGRLDDKGGFDPLESLGGSLLKFAANEPECMERVPSQANVRARRTTPPLFGLGLVEAIPDEAIIANAERQPKEVRGRVHTVTDVVTGERRVGRFGWKAQVATLLHFSGEASLHEMGLTSRLFPNPNPPNGDRDLLAQCDEGKHPKDTTGLIYKFTTFMRFLAPPPRGERTHDVEAGRYNFMQIGCGTCHTPTFTTGSSKIDALSEKRVHPFSDLLLHDIGTRDEIVQGEAQINEIRTPPLWGLRWRERPWGRLLHDASAVTIEEAISRHGGQAAAAREAFEKLRRGENPNEPNERQALIDFLRSL